MNERNSMIDFFWSGGPIFNLLVALFLAWALLAIFLLKRRSKRDLRMLALVVILPQCLVAGGVLLYLLSFRMLTDTLGTTGDRVDWLESHIFFQRDLASYSSIVVGLGLISSIAGWFLAMNSFRQLT